MQTLPISCWHLPCKLGRLELHQPIFGCNQCKTHGCIPNRQPYHAYRSPYSRCYRCNLYLRFFSDRQPEWIGELLEQQMHRPFFNWIMKNLWTNEKIYEGIVDRGRAVVYVTPLKNSIRKTGCHAMGRIRKEIGSLVGWVDLKKSCCLLYTFTLITIRSKAFKGKAGNCQQSVQGIYLPSKVPSCRDQTRRSVQVSSMYCPGGY